jgi:2-deoxy-D-gluconate 3-dehydrogenase
MASPEEHIPIQELVKLTDKKAIITGGAMGIGFAIANRFAEAGATVLLADLDVESAAKSVEELKKQNYKAYYARCDVSNEDDVKNMVQVAVRDMGGIDILVNNAGIYPRKYLNEMSLQDFEKVIAINLTGAFLCSKYASTRMMDQRNGSCIINIASIEALHPSSTGMAAYDASKGGLLMLTKSLARELGQHGIRVNAIAPGAVLSRGVTSQLGNVATEESKEQLKQLKSFMSRMVLGRMGRPDEIARVALFLASEMSSYITGDLLVADGGYLIS